LNFDSLLIDDSDLRGLSISAKITLDQQEQNI